MAFNVDNNINSAILSGMFGLNKASQGIAETAFSIAQQSRQSQTPDEFLTNAATQQLGNFKQLLPQGTDNLTNSLLSLQINGNNALANTKVIGTANETIGRIIDELV